MLVHVYNMYMYHRLSGNCAYDILEFQAEVAY